VGHTVQVNSDDDWNCQSTLELVDSVVVHSGDVSIRFDMPDRYDRPLPVTIGAGSCIENVGMGNEGCYMDGFIDRDDHMWFDYQVQEDAEGAYGYDESNDRYFFIDFPDFNGQRYFTYYVVRQSYIELTGHTYEAQSKSNEAYFTGIYNLNVEVHPDAGLGVAGIGVRIAYDPAYFTLRDEDAETCKAFVKGNADGEYVFFHNKAEHYINVSWAIDGNIGEDFTLGTLNFDIITPEGEQKTALNGLETEFSIELIQTEPGNDEVNCRNIVYRFGQNIEDVAPARFDLVGMNTYVKYMPGDVNGDMEVDIIDVVAILKRVVGYDMSGIVNFAEESPFDATTFRLSGDMDHDGYLTVLDAVMVYRLALEYQQSAID